jgi:hypothetical protein
MAFAVVASILLGGVMTLGDWAWAALEIRHRVVYGLAHGALMCLCLGLAVGVRVGKPAGGALAGPVIGIIAAGSFYLLTPMLRWSAMFPAWMLLWILFALLQQRLARKEAMTTALLRGVVAVLLSGAAFYAISGIWINDSHTSPNLLRHCGAWTIAFLPGFIALFASSRRSA